MIVAGFDIGSMTGKAVVMEGHRVVTSCVVPSRPDPAQTALELVSRVTESAGIEIEKLDCSVATGYGRKHVAFAGGYESEIACHAKGANFIDASIRTVVDIGGQDAKAIRLDEKGNVERYSYNDKCASGTGRFLEIVAGILDLDIGAMGEVSLGETKRLTLSNQCVVFAETEIITMINDGVDTPDILGALHRAVSNRVVALAKGIGVEREIAMTGGVALNKGMFGAIEHALKSPMIKVETPQIMGAMGAAVMAREIAEQRG